MSAEYFSSEQENDSSFHIFRTINGQECELALSEEELNLIYNMKAHEYIVADVRLVAEEQNLDISDKTAEKVAKDFHNSYEVHPSYWKEIEDQLRSELKSQEAAHCGSVLSISEEECDELEI